MPFKEETNAIAYYDEAGQRLGEITYQSLPEKPEVVIANHTFTDPALRGQGIAGQLVDELVKVMEREGKQIYPTCPYVVKKFADNPDKYDFINAAK